MSTKRTANIVWGSLLAVGVTVETYALLSGKDELTLTRTTQRATRIDPEPRKGHRLSGIALVLFLRWLEAHLLQPSPFPSPVTQALLKSAGRGRKTLIDEIVEQEAGVLSHIATVEQLEKEIA